MKKAFHIIGNRKQSGELILLIETAERSCSFGVFDESNSCLQEVSYYEGEPDDQFIQSILDQYLAKRKFNSSAVAYRLVESVLVPAEYYRMEQAGLHVETVYGPENSSSPVSEQLEEHQLYNVYRVPSLIHEMIKAKLPSSHFLHHYSVVLKSLPKDEGPSMQVDFKTDEFSVIASDNGKILLAQTFLYSAPEDVLYYLLKTAQQFGFSQETVLVRVSGMIENDSAIAKELHKFFINVQFETLPEGLELDESFGEYPQHYFSSLLKLARCA